VVVVAVEVKVVAVEERVDSAQVQVWQFPLALFTQSL
jgi:hypothetical protein